MNARGLTPVRLALLLFTLLASSYCFLSYVPFIWHQFIRTPHFAFQAGFVRWHPLLYWMFFGVGAALLRSALREHARRPAVRAMLAAIAGVGVVLLFRPALAGLANDRGSLVWSAVLWLPYFAFEGLVVLLAPAPFLWRDVSEPAEDLNLASASGQWAGAMALVFGGVALARSKAAGRPFSPLEIGVGVLWTAMAHSFIAATAWSAVVALRSAAALAGPEPRLEAVLLGAAGWTAALLVWVRLNLALLPYAGWPAWLHGALVATGLLAWWAGQCRQDAAGEVRSGVAFWTAPGRRAVAAAGNLREVSAVLLAVATAATVAELVPRLDWNNVLQNLAVSTAWFLFFQASVAMARTKAAPWRFAAAAAAALAVFAVVPTLRGSIPRLDAALSMSGTRVSATLEAFEGWDPSFRLARMTFKKRASAGEQSLYSFLVRHTNISRDTVVAAPDVQLSEVPLKAAAVRPNIFIIVVDSLRQDYVSVYNPAVGFTPQIDAFSKDAVVFRNAFTRYGATGLSEPSIWTGTSMLHKQYIQPFSPLNSLQKMLRADGYQGMVSRDSILSVVTEDSPDLENIEPNKLDRNFELCSSLKSIVGRLDQGLGGKPAFAYTQGQDVHVSVINREGRRVVGGASQAYQGFDAPYASRVARLDACFGEFIAELKRRKLYDDSVIVFTADHGDSLGEGGRWGHAYTLFPEIVRIPLLVRIPERWRGLYHDPEALAFSIDLTPSLYQLLGHGPVRNDPLYGRPLFTSTKAEHEAYRRPYYMLASSYGPVYGILSGNGTQLFIADGVNFRDHYFDLGHDPRGERNIVSPEVEALMEPRIREEVQRIAAFYKFPG